MYGYALKRREALHKVGIPAESPLILWGLWIIWRSFPSSRVPAASFCGFLCRQKRPKKDLTPDSLPRYCFASIKPRGISVTGSNANNK